MSVRTTPPELDPGPDPGGLEEFANDETLTDAELLAIIREARARTRRRRLRIAALVSAALMLAVAWWHFDGPGGPPKPSGDPREAAATAARPSQQEACPSQPARIDPLNPPQVIAGCQLTVSASLAQGWTRDDKTLSGMPIGSLGELADGLRFADFALGAAALGVWPVRVPASTDLALFMQADGKLKEPQRGRYVSRPLAAADFRTAAGKQRPTARNVYIYRGGWRFSLQARAKDGPPGHPVLAQANSLIDSITISGKLCPCRGE